jgi:high frequency lysogenization protein
LSAPERDRILALAGVFQSAVLVQQLARESRCGQTAYRASIHSILMLDAPDVASLYGGIGGVRTGLTKLREQLGGRSGPHEIELARYVIALVQLAGKLSRRADVEQELQEGISAARVRYFEELEQGHEVPQALVDDLAQLYTRTISNMNPRILVSGEHGYLTDPGIAARVRAGLLAGVRAGVAWLQLGGSRWQLLFSRRKLLREAENLLEG